MKLVEKPRVLDLTKSHASRRVLFVGTHWWDRINRPVTRWIKEQKVKNHGLWTFVLVPDVDEHFIAELPVLNAFMRRRRARAITAPKAASPDMIPARGESVEHRPTIH